MSAHINKRLGIFSILVTLASMLLWQIMFYNHTKLGEVLWEIQVIFIGIVSFYFLLSVYFTKIVIVFTKALIRILFRVWLLIFIAFSMNKMGDKAGYLLSAAFIFGYFEGLCDFDTMFHKKQFKLERYFAGPVEPTDMNRACLSIITLCIIHVVSAFMVYFFFTLDMKI
jgi:hypothetical protein